jgi:hypothetical protein
MQQQTSLLQATELKFMRVESAEIEAQEIDPFAKEVYAYIAQLTPPDAIGYLRNQCMHCPSDKRDMLQEIMQKVQFFKIACDRYLRTLNSVDESTRRYDNCIDFACRWIPQDGFGIATLLVDACGIRCQYVKNGYPGYGWLHFGAMFGNAPLTRYVLKCAQKQQIDVAALINTRNINGKRALDYVAELENFQERYVITQLLRDNGGLFGNEMQ